MSNLELLDRAAAATTCQILGTAGEALIDTAVWTLWNPKFSAVSFGAGALSLLAANYLCPDMPMGGDTSNNYVDGCKKVDGSGVLQILYDGAWIPAYPPGNNRYPEGQTAQEITKVELTYSSGVGKWIFYIEWA